jgi:hypothetical protein
MHERSNRPASSRLWDAFRLQWQIGLQRLPYFTQRLAVALFGVLVVSVSLVGVLAVLWGGPQRSELPLRPPPRAGDPAGAPPGGDPARPPLPPMRGGGQVPASARPDLLRRRGGSPASRGRGGHHLHRRHHDHHDHHRRRRCAAALRGAPDPPLTVPPVLTSLLP